MVVKYSLLIQETVGWIKRAWNPGMTASNLGAYQYPWLRPRPAPEEPPLDELGRRRDKEWLFPPIDLSWLRLNRLFEVEAEEARAVRALGWLLSPLPELSWFRLRRLFEVEVEEARAARPLGWLFYPVAVVVENLSWRRPLQLMEAVAEEARAGRATGWLFYPVAVVVDNLPWRRLVRAFEVVVEEVAAPRSMGALFSPQAPPPPVTAASQLLPIMGVG